MGELALDAGHPSGMCDLVAAWWTVCGPLSGAEVVIREGDGGVVYAGTTGDGGEMCVDGLDRGTYAVDLRSAPDDACPVAVRVVVPAVPRADDIGERPLPTWDQPDPWAGVGRWGRAERAWDRAGGIPALRDWRTCAGDAVHVVRIENANRRPRRWDVRSALVCAESGTWSITDSEWSAADQRFLSSKTEYEVFPQFWWSLLGAVADDRFVTRPPAGARGPTVVLVEIVGVAEVWRALPADRAPEWALGVLGE